MKALPTLSQQPPPIYTPGYTDNQMIATMIRNLNISIQNFAKKISSNATEVTRRKEPLLQASASVTSLLSTPVLVSSFHPGYSHPHIACTTSSALAWVKTGKQCIQLMDRDGTIQDTIHTEFLFYDVTITPQRDVLFSDCGIKNIVSASKEATSWRITPLFYTQYKPCGICSLRNSDVIVTYHFDHRVVQYSSKGDIIHKFDPKLFSRPYRVDVNKVNEDVYVCDTGRDKLLAFDKDHKLRHEYTVSPTSIFYLRDVTTDISGRVLFTDWGHKRIHVLDKDGKFLQYIQPPGLEEPCYIDVDSEGHAWIGELSKKVKIVKY